MMLRIMLVGFVASLGLELPSNDDVSHWARSGHQWASARLAELTELQAEAGLSFANQAEPETQTCGEAPTAPATSDLAFQAVVDQVAGDLAADIAAVAPASPATELVAKADAPAPMVEESAPAAPAPVAVAISDSELAEVPSDEEEVAMLTEISPSRAERINSAVKMTYQAVNAWASALQVDGDAEATR